MEKAIIKKYQVDEAEVEITFHNEQKIVISIEVKDQEVILPLDLADKKKMALLVPTIAMNLLATINNERFIKGPIRQPSLQIPPKCPICNSPLRYVASTCGGCSAKVVCTKEGCSYKANVKGKPPWA